jgi:archaemetzincin
MSTIIFPLPKGRSCWHASLWLGPSIYVEQTEYKRPGEAQRIAAATISKERPLLTSESLFNNAQVFPGPLILPGDDLATDPDCPAQDVTEWALDKERNPVTHSRKTIYLVPSPTISKEMAPMRSWSVPLGSSGVARPQVSASIDPPVIGDIREYIAAAYYGMEVAILPGQFSWEAWQHTRGRGKKGNSATKPKYNGKPLQSPTEEQRVGLKTPQDQLWGIRCRQSPDGVSSMQINLDDVLDALSENIPKDAYAIVMLLDQDIWEGDEDIFTSGRAYGGSRIAVLSRFRDHPSLAGVNEVHTWPLSHCVQFVERCYLPPGWRSKSRARVAGTTPMFRARSEAGELTDIMTPDMQSLEWMARVSQTTIHELGHCFGLEHCVYFSCVMQGSASSAEARRQPPYFCPICLEKIAHAIGHGAVEGWDDAGPEGREVRNSYLQNRYTALKRFCEKMNTRTPSRLLVGYHTWLATLLELM